MFNRHWLRVGTKIEMEHTSPLWTMQRRKRVAEKIAKDHLREFKSYYIVLPGAERRMAAIDQKLRKR